MKAAYFSKYGTSEVILIKEIPKPKPKKDEVLVKTICTTVNRTDTAMTSGKPFVNRLVTGIWGPKRNIPGTDFSGIVVEIGSEVDRFKVNDEVFGFDDSILSSHAEFLAISANGKIDIKPAQVSHEVAASSIEGPHYAINMLNYIDLKKGDKVLVNGATGGIGSALIQLLKLKNVEITAVSNTKNIELIKSYGVAKVLDYMTDDFTKQGIEYRYILDAVGKSSYKKCKTILAKDGKYISSELGKNNINLWLALTNRRVTIPIPKNIKESLQTMKSLLEDKNYNPIIDKRYALNEIQDAYKYVASGEKTGNVILNIISDPI